MTQAPASDPSTNKTASRIVIYLIEELGDARLRAAQLQGYVKEATDLIEKSEHRDHLFEVAAHLIQGIPEALFKLGKALDASAMAAARLDYEEIKTSLKPEKADELESVMEDNRIRYLQRRSDEEPMDPKQASDTLLKLAEQTHTSGQLPLIPLLGLIASLDRPDGRVAAQTSPVTQRVEEGLRKASEAILAKERPSKATLVASLRDILAEALQIKTEGAGEEFQKVNPAITDEEAGRIDEMHEENKDNLKTAGRAQPSNVLIPNLMNGADKLFNVRVPLRQVSDMIADLYSDATGTSDFSGYANPEIKKVRDAIYDLDRNIGSVARDMENLARTIDRATKTASQSVTASMDPGKWYKQQFQGGDELYFKPQTQLKNKNWSGLLVRYYGGRPEAAKQNSVSNPNLWSEVKESEIPPKVKAKFEARLASTETSEDKESRFEEGKPADPTENMSPEDAAEWKRQHAENKDNFKESADMTSQYAFGMAASKVQMAVDAFAYAEDTQGYARGWSNLSKGLTILSEFFQPLMGVVSNHLDKAADAARRSDFNVSIAGYQHLESAQKDLSSASDTARSGNIQGSFKKLTSAMAHMAEMGKEARSLTFAKAVADAGVLFKKHDSNPFEDKTATEGDKESRFEEGKPADPTENMDSEDAAEWDRQNKENKDNFKAAYDYARKG